MADKTTCGCWMLSEEEYQDLLKNSDRGWGVVRQYSLTFDKIQRILDYEDDEDEEGPAHDHAGLHSHEPILATAHFEG
jgi:hypothetical protein